MAEQSDLILHFIGSSEESEISARNDRIVAIQGSCHLQEAESGEDDDTTRQRKPQVLEQIKKEKADFSCNP